MRREIAEFVRASVNHPLFLWIVFAVMLIAALAPR